MATPSKPKIVNYYPDSNWLKFKDRLLTPSPENHLLQEELKLEDRTDRIQGTLTLSSRLRTPQDFAKLALVSVDKVEYLIGIENADSVSAERLLTVLIAGLGINPVLGYALIDHIRAQTSKGKGTTHFLLIEQQAAFAYEKLNNARLLSLNTPLNFFVQQRARRQSF